LKGVSVKIPATTANLGPGFDCLGLALGLYNVVTLTTVAEGLTITIEGEGEETLSKGSDNLVVKAAELVFEKTGKRPPGLIIHQQNQIPIGSGLGSSAAATLGGLIAANSLLDEPLTSDQVLQMATEIEKHPDNVAPAFFGGLTLINQEKNELFVDRIEIPKMWVIIVLPDFDFSTSSARAVLPDRVPFKDAIYNLARMGLLIRALEAGDYEKLFIAMRDKLHQNYRIPLIPGMRLAFSAAYQAGAKGVVLSGAGPSMAVFAPDDHEKIGFAIQSVFTQVGLKSRVWILPVDTRGCQILTA